MRQRILLQFLVFVFALLPLNSGAIPLEIKEISLLSVNSAITPATFDYLKRNFDNLPESSLIVLRLNTPGGLVSTTKDIITMVGRKKRPFVVWITPEGASAASAGAIIASAAHFIFMSPGTNMGAATPVGLGEDLKESDGRKKALNDLTALVRSLSASRGRPAGPFEKMITSADSYTADEALKLQIIDGVISSESDMLPFLTSRKINLDGVEKTITPKDLSVRVYEPTLGQKILEVLSNPSTAYILFLVGVALIYFEFQALGGFIAGAVGLCFLILAAISFQVLPLDWGSMGLIIAGIFLLILELFIVSYGILTIAGLIAFIMGSLFLFHGESGFISIEYRVIFSSLAGVATGLGIVAWYLYRESKKRKRSEDFFLPIGAKGHILTKLSRRDYQVKVKGEIWKACSEEELAIDEQVEIIEVDTKNLLIKIKKTSNYV
jgi:membrane-bound serine protease (ClpP class)